MQYYLCIDKDGNYYTEGGKRSVPVEAVLKIDESLKDKKLKIIEVNKTDLDGNPVVDAEGKPLKEKVAVLDEVAQTEYEAKLKAEKEAQEAAKLELDNKIKAVKDQTKTKKMTDEQITAAFDLIFELLGR